MSNYAIYHRVMRRENFEKAAKDLFELLQATQQKSPNAPRMLYLDIDGHRNDEGGFDKDMLELQQEFCLGFLMPYFTEMHLPLISVKNPKGQCNDIPDKLQILNAENKKDNSLDKLYIENYSNTEFVSEEDVYEYMEKVSNFLKDYNGLDTYYALMDKADYDPNGWITMWRLHLKDLINELFTAFLYGNLISVAAMTRSLIECYVYLNILIKEENPTLIDEWYICNIIKGISKYSDEGKIKIKEMLKQYCQSRDIDFDSKWELYSSYKENESSWLKSVMKEDRISFRKVCKYIGEEEIYNDFQTASSFVHGQSIITKQSPFTFYSSIYNKLFLMMIYMFKSICLFPITEDIEAQIEELEERLIDLGKRYSKF